jgi:SAM-dependent methyltransferase
MIRLLYPGWPDEARLVSQLPTLVRVTDRFPLTGRCLNAGCGEGLYCPFIDSYVAVTEVVNVDLEGTSQRLRHLQYPRHKTVDASLTNLPFQDAFFDSCLCTEVLEHIPDDEKAVQEIARCVRSGGKLLISVPHPPAPYDPNHVREGYMLPVLRDLLDRNGFTVAQSSRCLSAWLAWLLHLWRWQYLTLGRGRRNYMPRWMVRLFGYADRVMPVGPRWDLVVLAVRR